MKKLSIILIIFFCTNCKSEDSIVKGTLTKEELLRIKKGEIVTKYFNGKLNWERQYWRGNFQSNIEDNKVKVTHIGHWEQFSNENPREVFATCDYSNNGYVKNAKIFNIDGSIESEVVCHDTIIANKKGNRCTVLVYNKNRKIKYLENRISYEPNIYKYLKHGSQITYDSIGREIEHLEFENDLLKNK